MSEAVDVSAEPAKILILSGPSGSGKSTVVRELLRRSPISLRLSVSATTRPPRPGETDGREYYFLSHEEFRQRREAGEFLECAEVYSTGNWYGTLKSEVERAQAARAWALLEIDVQGAQSVLQHYPEAVSLFLRTSTDDVFERRLRGRGTESEDIIQRRLETARIELQHAAGYQHQVFNDDLQHAVDKIIEILQTQEHISHA